MRPIVLVLGIMGIAPGQSASRALLTNLDTAKWTQEKGGVESAMLRKDPASGGMEMLVRFPAGHVIPAHSHDSNERLIVLEGQLTARQDAGDTVLNSGGFAFLPASRDSAVILQLQDPLHFLSFLGRQSGGASREVGLICGA